MYYIISKKIGKKRVLLNGQTFPQDSINSGVVQGSILGLLLFPTLIINLPERLFTDVMLLEDNKSFFCFFFFIQKICYGKVMTIDFKMIGE